nr:glycosyltransferase [Synechococcus sp. WH 8016]
MGGTEIFIHQLISAQLRLNPSLRLLWAAHNVSTFSADHSLKFSLELHQCLLPAVHSGGRVMQVASTALNIPGFKQLLDDFKPDVVHLHSFSDRCGLSHAYAAKAVGAQLVVSVHAPGFSCMNGTLIDASGKICDGVLRKRRCTRCRLHYAGLPRWLAAAVALQGGWPMSAETPGAWAHVLTWKQLTGEFHAAWQELTYLADSIFVLAAWSRDVLLRQGIAAEKVHLIRTAGPPPLLPRKRTPMQDGILRLVYWGRCHSVKGLHLVIEAILDLPLDASVQIDFYGPDWNDTYGQQLLRRIDGDQRFRVLGPLPKEKLLPKLQTYDLAVVPSTWLETGPLTVLEAFAAGLPVAGSNLGGIKELLEGVDGCFRLPLEVVAWRRLFIELMTNPRILSRFSSPSSRQFSHIANEMFSHYGYSK